MQQYLQSRLTMYALLSEMERDLRTFAVSQLATTNQTGKLFAADVFGKICERLCKDLPNTTLPYSLQDLVQFTDLGDLYQLLGAQKALLTDTGRQLLQQISKDFETVIAIRNRVMHSRPINFRDLPIIINFAEGIASRFPHFFPHLIGAIDRLKTEPSFVFGLTIPTPYDDNNCFHNLPFPDFDETGFIGREIDLETLHKNIRGPFPVLSVLGEGGLGKTSLALKVAYEILEQPNNPFKAIIWSTSKSALLTAHDIRQIDNAIRDSLHLLADASISLGGLKDDDPVENIYAYMREYRVLLILDNLETVIDERIRAFVQGIPTGSKIILTSRIGLEANLSHTLRPMDESVDLLRALAEVRHVESLVQTNNKQLAIFTKRLHQNPLAIKWFVTAVQSGVRPEDVLQEQSLLLEYCISNVYKHLSEDSRAILSVFQTAGKSLDVAHLVALTGMEAARVKAALLQLDGANMITMTSKPSGASYETTFAINHMALTYMNKHHVVSASTRNEIEKRRRRFIAMIEEVRGTTKASPFSRRTIKARTETEVMVAGILLSAIDAVKDPKTADFVRADGDIEQAKSIAPGFFEVHRVEAYIRYSAKRVAEAVTAYEAAVELEPNHPPLRLWFAQMLLRENNFPDARTQLEHALKLSPKEPALRLESARLELYERAFEKCRSIINDLLAESPTNDTYVRMAWDIRIQSYLREAEYELIMNRSPANALPKYEAAKAAYELMPGEVNDRKIKEKVSKAHKTIGLCERNLREGDLGSRAYVVREWCEGVRDSLAETDALILERKGVELIGSTVSAVVSKLLNGFGYLKVADGRVPHDVYFHRSHVNGFRWSDLYSGCRVTCVIARQPDGRLYARSIQIL